MNEARANDYLNRYDLRAVIATTPTNVTYFTGFDCWLYREYTENYLVLGAPRKQKETFALFAQDSRPVLLTDTYTCLFAEELEGIQIQSYGGPDPVLSPARDGEPHHLKFFRDVRKNQKESPGDALVAALRAAGIDGGRVGIEAANLRVATRRAVSRALPGVELVDATELISLIRMVKTDEEIALLKTASEINEDALFESLALAHRGVPIGELSDAYLARVAKKGALFDHYFYSPDGLYLSDAPKYKLRKGEYTIIDSGCTFKHYYGDMGTSILVGPRRQDVVRKYEAIWNAVESLADKVGPGVKPSEIMEEFKKAYAPTGLRNPDYQGHGIGLEPREYPIMGQGGVKTLSDGVIRMDRDLPLEQGMVISLETSLYEFESGSFEVEKTFLVGKRGLTEITSKRDRSMLIV